MNGQLNETKNEDRFYWPLITDCRSTSPFYITSPRLRRKAGTSKSSCSKFATIALRIVSSEITSPLACAIATGDDSTIRGSSTKSCVASRYGSENGGGASGPTGSGKSILERRMASSCDAANE